MPRQKKPTGKRPRFGDARSLDLLHRKPGKRQPRRILVIVCEGLRTEPEYFWGFRERHRLSTLDIQIVKGQGAPISIVREGIRQKKKLSDKKDEVWCVFDTEVKAKNPSFDRAVDLARANRLSLAVSNPAFEYWYILHFECTDRPFHDAADAIKRLEEHLPHYDKKPAFQELETRILAAIQNAQKLRQGASEPWDEFPNPSTAVDRLVLVIDELAKES